MSDRMCNVDGRELIALIAASGIVISAWSLFPNAESGVYVPLPEASAPSAAISESAKKDVAVVSPSAAGFALASSHAESLQPTSPERQSVWFSGSAVDVSVVTIRSKLEALLMMLNLRSGGVDGEDLEEKILALLRLPDSLLVQLMEHPDLADLNEMLDAVFFGTSDLRNVKTELDKIDVTSVPGTSEQIQVVRISGNVAYAVRTRTADERVVDSVLAAESVPKAAGGPVMTMASRFDALADVIVSAFTLAPNSQLPPPPAPAMAMTMAPAAAYSGPAPLMEPSHEPPPPPAPPTPDPTPTQAPETSKPPADPVETPRTSNEVMNSGNMFEPGETAAQQDVDHSPSTSSAATQTDPPSEPASSPAEPEGMTSGEGEPSPSGE